METEEEEKLTCNTCHKELGWNEYKCFGGQYEENKKVWCEGCWNKLQEYLKRKWKEEKLPELQEHGKKLLEECEQNKKKFINLITQTKRFLTSLEKFTHSDDIKIYTKQHELEFKQKEEENGNT